MEERLTPSLAGVVAAAESRLKRMPGVLYWAAVGLVVISLGVRVLLEPIVTAGYGYTCFYPAVILSAYWLGARPGLLAAGLSTVIVFNFLGPSPFTFWTDGRGLVSLGFFLVSSLLLIHVLSTIRGRFEDLSRRHARVEALAGGQAELFREHAQRTTDHLQLISAILQVRGRDEADPLVSRVLTNAASRTLLISRTHREFTGGERREIPFEAFARKLVEAAAARGGPPAARVNIIAGDLETPLEHATAMGLLLLDYLTTLKDEAPGATLSVVLADSGDERTLGLGVSNPGGDAPAPRDLPLFEAVAEQLAGRITVTGGQGGCREVRIAFPSSLQPPPAWRPLAFSLH